MSGFVGLFSNATETEIVQKQKCYTDKSNIIKYNNLSLKSHFISKFENDKVFKEDSDVIICMDGVVLNLYELKCKEVTKDCFSTIKKLFYKMGINFVKELRGNFSGCIYDKRTNEFYMFTNHMGTKPLYYFYDVKDKTFIFSSSIKKVTRHMSDLQIKLKLSEIASYFLLTYGYMLEDYTLVEEVKKLKPGSYIKISSGKLEIITYYKLDNESYINDNQDKIIYELNDRFTKAIKRGFDKDLEYNYRHISNLSGGLDSRIISFYAKKLGYQDLLNINFAQSNSLDRKIAEKISTDLGFTFLYNSLDCGNYLKNIKSVVRINEGQNLYLGTSHGLSMLTKLNWENFGLIHNGNAADVMHGDYVDAPYHTKPKPERWAYSSKLLNKISNINNNISEKYPNHELFVIYNRAINGIFDGMIASYDLSETDQPFLDIDLIEYASKIHPKYKYGEFIFLKMIERYMPEAAKYKWERWNRKPTVRNYYILNNKAYSFNRKAWLYLKRKIMNHSPKSSMNPYDYWYENNTELVKFTNAIFNENIELLDNHINLKNDARDLFYNGNFIEKSQVLTLLEAYDFLISGKE